MNRGLIYMIFFTIVCLAIFGLSMNCSKPSTAPPAPPPGPEIIDHVTGVKILAEVSQVTLIVLYKPALESAFEQTITVYSLRNNDIKYFADVPDGQPAQVRVFDSNYCLRDGYCNGNKTEVHLHSFNELH